MSKPPPPNESQPQADRTAYGVVNHRPTAGAPGNPLFLQQPLSYSCWPPLMQAPSLVPGMSLFQQYHPLMAQVQSTPVPFSLGNNAHGYGSGISQNCNDLDTTAVDDMNNQNDSVATSDKATTTTSTHGSCNIPDEDTETLYVDQIFPNETAFDTAVEKYCNDRNYFFVPSSIGVNIFSQLFLVL